MAKDKRYEIIKKLVMAGVITRFSEVFDILPKTTWARDMQMHHYTFGNLIRNPAAFTLRQIYEIASLLEIDEWEAIKMIHIENMNGKKIKKKKKSDVNRKRSL
jgi:hypothetical protein